MAENQSVTLLQNQLLREGDKSGKGVDLGAFNVLKVHINVHVVSGAGSGELVMQHAAVDEECDYADLGNGFDLNDSGPNTHDQTDFLRFIRWRTGNTFTTDPTVSLIIIAKSG